MGDGDEKLDGRKQVKVRPGSTKHFFNRIKVFVGHFGLFVALIIYTGIGAWVFQTLEGPYEIDRKTTLKHLLLEGRTNFTRTVLSSSLEADDLNYTFSLALETYDKIIEEVTSEGMSVLNPEVKSDWDYIQSAFFASTVLTTIGYGNMAPKTHSGRVFCIFFALIGIPFTLTVIADLGKLMASAVSSSYKSCRRHFPKEIIKSSSKLRKSATVGAAVGSLLLYISAGGYFFTLWEEWSFFDSFYFCFITMTTIGFGDLVPEKTTYMLLCTIYIMVGLALTSTAIELVRIQYADSWKKMRELSSRLQGLSGPLAESLKKMGGNTGRAIYGDNINLDVNVLQDLKELKKALAMSSKAMKREGSIWKKFWENEDEFDIDMVESDEPRLIQIIIYESSV
ncbi:TWiK family of potassium channels protein 7 isoform X2 [Folsomia candida]|uniref:TWiK family of potassium channels protein 7 isoform X2 n=1 Tax=Folsomia candida TaxID=158441 RepID=UPI001604A93A|nr:TWiK family of potassium channels protein 7 isoform X2 [Folsomia candida]